MNFDCEKLSSMEAKEEIDVKVGEKSPENSGLPVLDALSINLLKNEVCQLSVKCESRTSENLNVCVNEDVAVNKNHPIPSHHDVSDICSKSSVTIDSHNIQNVHESISQSTVSANSICSDSQFEEGYVVEEHVKECVATLLDEVSRASDLTENVPLNIITDDGIGNREPRDYALPYYDCEGMALLISGAWEEFKGGCEECFTKGCKWSPDGTCILTNSEDKMLRIFDLPPEVHCQETWPLGRVLPELRPTLKVREGGRIYDYCWYPFMSSWNPLSCCLVASSQFSPVHLWDAYSGQLRATYRAYNCLDEIDHAFSVAFDLTGQRLYCGFKKRICVFDTAVPGSTCETRSLKDIGRTVGIISCICVNPANDRMYAFSSYSRTIGVCSEPDGDVICLLGNDGGGLTHLMFSPDGHQLFAGSRKDSLLYCWDMRMLGRVLFTAKRPGDTNQRIYFDLTPDGRYLLSGSTDGHVLVWDTLKAPADSTDSSQVPLLPLLSSFPAHGDCVNGLSLHKQYPVLATSSGQRHAYCPDCDSDEEGEPGKKKRHVRREDTLKLWWMGHMAQSGT